jgi:5-hydroxyisourate hydrolase
LVRLPASGEPETASSISTHVLDTALGRPAPGVYVVLERVDDNGATTPVGSGETDNDGRLRDLLAPGGSLVEGTYRLTFQSGEYFARTQRETFFPTVVVMFRVGPGAQPYHVPLLISPYGYSTYRGS